MAFRKTPVSKAARQFYAEMKKLRDQHIMLMEGYERKTLDTKIKLYQRAQYMRLALAEYEKVKLIVQALTMFEKHFPTLIMEDDNE